jgi:hypothetical protein
MVRGSSIIGIILTLIILAILIWNIVYISGVRRVLQSGTNLGLSPTGANILFWINIIAIVLVGIYLIYNLWLVFTSRDQRATYQQVVTEALTRPRASTTTASIPDAAPTQVVRQRTTTTSTNPAGTAFQIPS